MYDILDWLYIQTEDEGRNRKKKEKKKDVKTMRC